MTILQVNGCDDERHIYDNDNLTFTGEWHNEWGGRIRGQHPTLGTSTCHGWPDAQVRQFLICYQVASFRIQVKPLSCHTSKGKVGHTLWWVSSLYHYNFHYDHQQHCNLALPINNCKITKKWNPRKHSWLFDVRDESADERKKSSTLPGCHHFHNHFDIIANLCLFSIF